MLTELSEAPSLIRQWRKAAGITQLALADSLGVTWNCVAKWEAGDRKPSLSRLSEIAEALGATVRLFSRGAPSVTPQ